MKPKHYTKKARMKRVLRRLRFKYKMLFAMSGDRRIEAFWGIKKLNEMTVELNAHANALYPSLAFYFITKRIT